MRNALFHPTSILAPLNLPIYRRSWAASFSSNSALLILGVGAGWTMTQLTNAPDQIALVQTALMLPVAILALPGGAIGDIYDRRIVGLIALGIASLGAIMLVTFASLGALTPATLLGCCFIVAGGVAVFNPVWQASVNEQVPPDALPAAVALNSISFNIARSIGPAIGGVIVAVAGSSLAFIATAVGYLPMLAVLYSWRYTRQASHLPPEGLKRAVVSGVRYVIHSPPIAIVLARTALTSLSAASVPALLPLIVRNQLGGDARTYGALLGAFGIGGIISALLVPRVRRTADPELTIRACLLAQAVAFVGIALSHSPIITAVALILSGAGWMMSNVLFNVGVQLASPRWVSARVLATFQVTVTGCMGIGGWIWGVVAKHSTLETPVLLSAALMAITLVFGFWLRMPHIDGSNRESAGGLVDSEPALEGKRGPISIEIEYRVDPAKARDFYEAMLAVQRSRKRNGASAWSLAREIAEPEIWIERLRYPTWHDYLRQLHRPTPAERELQARAVSFHQGQTPVRVRRFLERPYEGLEYGESRESQGGQMSPSTESARSAL